MNRRRGVAATKNRQERSQKIAQRGEQLQKDDVAHLEDQESCLNVLMHEIYLYEEKLNFNLNYSSLW